MPPIKSGSWTYLDTMYDSVFSFSARRSSALFHCAEEPSLAAYPLLHFLICVNLLMRKMPLP